MTTLYHPNTARAIEVDDKAAADWREAGWLDKKPSLPNDAPEGDAPAAAGDQADADQANADTTTTTRGRAKK